MQQEPLGRDLLARHLPDRLLPIYKLCAFVALPLAVALAGLRLGLVIVDLAPRYAIVDFRYFYVAGVAVLDGLSVYGDAYIALGQQIYDGSFLNAFFYSPTVLPLLAPLGLMAAGPASAAFMVVTASTIIASAAASGWILRHRPMLVDWRIVTAVAVVVGAGILRPSISTLFLGSGKFLMLAGLVLWMAGALRGAAGQGRHGWEDWMGLGLQSVGLAIVLMKPQYGVVLFLVCIVRPAWRLGAIGAVLVSALLYGVAALPHGLFGYAFDFLESVSAYSGRPENSGEVLIGLYGIAGNLGVDGGVVMTLTLSVLAAAFLCWFLPEVA
ncbi:MAG: glycosyltransferase 87 family protein, partial [Pseudomonadota bacterium]